MRFLPLSFRRFLPVLLLVFSGVVRAEFVELFNGRDLEGWRAYLSDPAADAGAVFSVTEAGTLRIAGEPSGYLCTVAPHTRYRLVVEWRWVDRPANSGVLLHRQGPDRIWPLCVEAQLKSSRAGDIVFMGMGSGGRVGGETLLVTNPEHPFWAADRQREASEHPAGEWNRYEIVADGTLLRLTVNGVLQNEAADLSLTSGEIALQSEGGPIEFRRIALEPLE